MIVSVCGLPELYIYIILYNYNNNIIYRYLYNIMSNIPQELGEKNFGFDSLKSRLNHDVEEEGLQEKGAVLELIRLSGNCRQGTSRNAYLTQKSMYRLITKLV